MSVVRDRVLIALAGAVSLAAQQTAVIQKATAEATVVKYCATCHSNELRTADLSLQDLDLNKAPEAAETWEKVIRKLRVGAMRPPGAPRPDKAAPTGLASYLETTLDRAYAANPN